MERIKYEPVESRIVSGSREEIESGAKILDEFFNYFHNHLGSSFTLRECSAYFYCGLPYPATLSGHRIRDLYITVPSDIKIPEVFYDNSGNHVDVSVLPPQVVFRIYVNQWLAGYYFRKSQVLLATDWTHNWKTIQVLKAIVNFLPLRKRKKKTKKYRVKITLGADPEFEIVKSGKVVSAGGIISGGTGSTERIGKDGAGYQVELRPAPASKISQAVRNFKELLIEFVKTYPDLRLSCQGDIYPLGGHIHIGAPFTGNFLTVLDNWIGKQVIDLSGVARGSYKKLGAYEIKRWGFEYRTPPAAIFHNKKVLRAVYKIVKVLAEHYYNRDGVTLYPNEEEIKRLKLEKEWNILQDFVKSYRKLNKDILSAWRISRRIRYEIELRFFDDWSPEIVDFVRNIVVPLLRERINKSILARKKIKAIIFFGFKKERGLVCNFNSSLLQKIDFNYTSCSDVKAFGFPYEFRVNTLTDELKAKWNVLIDEVLNELKLKRR
jgi:hypothetical protein